MFKRYSSLQTVTCMWMDYLFALYCCPVNEIFKKCRHIHPSLLCWSELLAFLDYLFNLSNGRTDDSERCNFLWIAVQNSLKITHCRVSPNNQDTENKDFWIFVLNICWLILYCLTNPFISNMCNVELQWFTHYLKLLLLSLSKCFKSLRFQLLEEYLLAAIHFI